MTHNDDLLDLMQSGDEMQRRADAQPISREHATMIDVLQGELNKALARIAELESGDAELRRQLEQAERVIEMLESINTTEWIRTPSGDEAQP